MTLVKFNDPSGELNAPDIETEFVPDTGEIVRVSGILEKTKDYEP